MIIALVIIIIRKLWTIEDHNKIKIVKHHTCMCMSHWIFMISIVSAATTSVVVPIGVIAGIIMGVSSLSDMILLQK